MHGLGTALRKKEAGHHALLYVICTTTLWKALTHDHSQYIYLRHVLLAALCTLTLVIIVYSCVPPCCAEYIVKV